MAFRIALVTPFSWSQPHDVNEHVAGLAAELRARGHRATVLGPSNRARDLAAGRRALATGLDADFVALGPARPRATRAPFGPARRTACDERGDRGGGGAALPGPVRARPARGRPRAACAGTEAKDRRRRVAAAGAAASARGRARARRAA